MTTSRSTHDSISSDRVEGAAVYDSAGDKLGSIDHLVIDKKSGLVRYAVMEFGGLLGMATDRYPIPWNMLQYDTTKDGYVAPLDKARLQDAPRHPLDDAPDYDEAYDSSVKTYYGF
jgi:sporulation protein YlmC with PRC-barrel domain